ncbi:hypothetical protein ABZ639_31780 [Saccharomonospora sp. NPDC006951]
MRNPVSVQARTAVRARRATAVLVAMSASLFTLGTGTASAAQAEPNAMTFGLLGPVGLVAIVLGVIGMTAGVVRQRMKKARAVAAAPVPVVAEPEPAMVPLAVAEPVYSRQAE